MTGRRVFPHFLLCLSDTRLQACPFLIPESLAFSTREASWGMATHGDSRLRFHHPVPSSGQRAETPPCRWPIVQGVANVEAEARAREASLRVWNGKKEWKEPWLGFHDSASKSARAGPWAMKNRQQVGSGPRQPLLKTWLNKLY